MKTTKKLSLITFICLLLLFLFSQANAQGYYSYNNATHKSDYRPDRPWKVFTLGGGRAMSGYTFNAMFDHETLNDVSVGLAITLKRSSRVSERLQYTPSQDFDKLNIGIRVLQHFPIDDELDLYCGIRGGVSLNFNEHNTFPALPSFQGVGGLRYLSPSGVGFNFELGLGQPYMVAAGVSFAIK